MKLLLFYAPSFWFKTFRRVLESVPDLELEESFQEAVVVFYQAEAHDVERRAGVITKFVKNVKWLAGKHGTKTIVLHSFNHLSPSKADPGFTASLVGEVQERLERSGYRVGITPFGYLNEWKLHVAGDSLAKVFKEI